MTEALAIHSPPPKWRPSLAMVVGAVLATVMILPLAGMAAVVAFSRAPDALLESLGNNGGKIAAAGILVVAVTALLGFLFWRLVTRPVRELVAWTEAVGAGQPVGIAGDGRFGTRELARLADSFGRMVDRLRERATYIETFTAHVSHELKSPLTSIRGAAELMRDSGETMDAATRGRFLENIETDVNRLSTLVERMRELARAETSAVAGSVPLIVLVTRLRAEFSALDIKTSGATLGLAMPFEAAWAVFSHLAHNAVHHGARRMSIDATLDGTTVRTRVWNDGEPISAGNRTRIFEPFYTTRREGGGTGMGLPIAQAMLKTYGGAIVVENAAEGAAFTVSCRKYPA